MWNKPKKSFHAHGHHGYGNAHGSNRNHAHAHVHAHGHSSHGNNSNHSNHSNHTTNNANTPTSVEEGEISSPHASKAVNKISPVVNKPKTEPHNSFVNSEPGSGAGVHVHGMGMGAGAGMGTPSSFRSNHNHNTNHNHNHNHNRSMNHLGGAGAMHGQKSGHGHSHSHSHGQQSKPQGHKQTHSSHKPGYAHVRSNYEKIEEGEISAGPTPPSKQKPTNTNTSLNMHPHASNMNAQKPSHGGHGHGRPHGSNDHYGDDHGGGNGGIGERERGGMTSSLSPGPTPSASGERGGERSTGAGVGSGGGGSLKGAHTQRQSSYSGSGRRPWIHNNKNNSNSINSGVISGGSGSNHNNPNNNNVNSSMMNNTPKKRPAGTLSAPLPDAAVDGRKGDSDCAYDDVGSGNTPHHLAAKPSTTASIPNWEPPRKRDRTNPTASSAHSVHVGGTPAGPGALSGSGGGGNNGGNFRNNNNIGHFSHPIDRRRGGISGGGGGGGRPWEKNNSPVNTNNNWGNIGGGGGGRQSHGGNPRFDYNKKGNWRRGSNSSNLLHGNDTAGGGNVKNYYGPKTGGNVPGIRSEEKNSSIGNYYGSNSNRDGNASNSSGHNSGGGGVKSQYSSRGSLGLGGTGSGFALGDGPRFQPPPGKGPFQTSGGSFNANSNAASMKYDHDDRYNTNTISPAKSRMDGALVSARSMNSKSQNHQKSPYSSPGIKKSSHEDHWKRKINGSLSASAEIKRGGESPKRYSLPSPERNKAFENTQRNAQESGQVLENIEPGQIHDSPISKTSVVMPKVVSLGIESKSVISHPPIPVPQVRLTCAALGDIEKSSKAIKVISKLAVLVVDESLKIDSETSEDINLPTTEQIHKGKLEVDLQIGNRRTEIDSIKKQIADKAKIRKAMMDSKIAEEKDMDGKEKERRSNALTPEPQGNLKVDTSTNESERIALKEVLLKDIHRTNGLMQSSGKELLEKKEMIRLNDYRVLKTEVAIKYDKLIAEAQESLKKSKTGVESASVANKNFDEKLKTANKDLSKIPTAKSKLTNTAHKSMVMPNHTGIGPTPGKLKSQVSDRLGNILHATQDMSVEMNCLISTILLENKRTAEMSQKESKAVLPDLSDGCTDSFGPPMLVLEQAVDEDEATVNKYIADWNKLANHVTGPGNALYSEPTEAPLYDNIRDHHNQMRPLVREHVRSKKRKLYHRWTELAQEYAVREQLYSKDSKKNLNGVYSIDTIGESFSILGQRRGGGSSNSSFLPEAPSGSRTTSNPYRSSSRTRRSAGAGYQSGLGGCDIVRSDYEQEQIIAQLTAQENMEKRIKLGGSELPRQVCLLERQLSAIYNDNMTSRRVQDALKDEREHQLINPWSDIEKCIFFDRFLQHPKDFRKIASFLKNKTTHDCIAFYYDSKQSVPYKAALKEHMMRKKRRGDGVGWEATIQAAISLGATVTLGVDNEKPLLFTLPEHDQTFNTRLFHPLKLDLFDPNISEVSVDDLAAPSTRPSSKRRGSMSTLFTLDPSHRKYLRAEASQAVQRTNSSSDMDNSLSSAKMSRSSSTSNMQDRKGTVDKGESSKSSKKISVWTNSEKATFFKMYEKHGKKWDILVTSIETKSLAQVRSFYQENKKNLKNKVNQTPKKSKVSVTQPFDGGIASNVANQPKTIETSLTANQIAAIHVAKMGQSGGNALMPSQETNNGATEVMMPDSLIPGQGWHPNHQLALALEQQRQQLYDRHLLAQQQHLMGQRQLQQQHLLELMNRGEVHWRTQVALQHQHQRQQQESLREGGTISTHPHLQNILRQVAHQRQQQMQLQGLNPNSDNNDSLSLLARMASDASNQQNR
mmetsp:Transcript_24493/g.36323  ORF Transcript_24493/g.36323 Transcript_24493/m.36323 type:complete len:1822 (-) Transcript_24493:45-5510(-)